MKKLIEQNPKTLFKIYGTKEWKLTEWLKSYINNNTVTFTAREATIFVNSKLNTEYSVTNIRNFMKDRMSMSYKRVKSRPSNINIQKIDKIRSLFAVKLSKEITFNSLLINIDESSINRFVKSNYSWGYKGKPVEWRNASFTESISWVLAICSNGSWLWFLSNQTIDGKTFVWFTKILDNWLKLYENFGYNEVIIILDNWSIHKGKLTQGLLKKLSYKVFYIPAYSPEFAPVEMSFSLLKRTLSESNKNKGIKLSFRQNLTKIYQSLQSLTSKTIKRMFGRLFKTMKDYLAI